MVPRGPDAKTSASQADARRVPAVGVAFELGMGAGPWPSVPV
jgi:hypothetical protein